MFLVLLTTRYLLHGTYYTRKQEKSTLVTSTNQQSTFILSLYSYIYLFTFACTYTCTPYVELLYMLKLPLVNDLLTGKLTTSTTYIAGEAYSYRR